MSAPELAFPCTENNFTNWASTGMTLRDYFAAHALSMLASWHKNGLVELSGEAYDIADAMMKERGAIYPDRSDAPLHDKRTTEIERLTAEVTAMASERDEAMDMSIKLAHLHDRQILVMQAALLTLRNEGSAENALTWIFAILKDADQLPDTSEPLPSGSVQEWFDTKMAELDADGTVRPAQVEVLQ